VKKIAVLFVFFAVFLLSGEVFAETGNDFCPEKGEVIQIFDTQLYKELGIVSIPILFSPKSVVLKEIKGENGEKTICLWGRLFLMNGLILSEERKESEVINVRYEILGDHRRLQLEITPGMIKSSREEKEEFITKLYPLESGENESGLGSLLDYLRSESKNSRRVLFPFDRNLYAVGFRGFPEKEGNGTLYVAVMYPFKTDDSKAVAKDNVIKNIRIKVEKGEIIRIEGEVKGFRIVATRASE